MKFPYGAGVFGKPVQVSDDRSYWEWLR